MAVPLRFFLGTLAALFLLGGCGYHFSGEGSGPRPGLKAVAIPVFVNKTSEPDLGAIFAEALRKEFIQKGPMAVVPVEEADAVFKATIKEIFNSPVAHRHIPRQQGTQVTLESRLHVVLDIRCVDARNGKVLWQDANFNYYQVYQHVRDPHEPDSMFNFESRQSTLELLSREMAVRIHDRFLSNF